MSILDEVFEMFDAGIPTTTRTYSVPSFPPCNINIVKDGVMYLDFALAGYSKEDLGIDYDSEKSKLLLFTKKDYKSKLNRENCIKTLANGIKRSSFTYSYFVPEAKFDIANLKAQFVDGILTITIPPKKRDEAKTSFIIN